MDEFWSFVGSKTQRRWTWYAIERKSGVVVAWHNGSRGKESLEALLEKMRIFPINSYSTDDWVSYLSLLPADKYYIGKDRTWKIERKNLNFRTHLKLFLIDKNELI